MAFGDMSKFAWFQRCIEAELGPDFVADVLAVESAATCCHQGHFGQPCEVRSDCAQRERYRTERGRCLVPVQVVVIDVKAVDEDIGFATLVSIDAQPILVRALDHMVVNHREVEAGWGILHSYLGSLLMHPAAVEYREQVSELHCREIAERQLELIFRHQVRAVEAYACAGEVAANNRAVLQPLVKTSQLCLVEVRSCERHAGFYFP